MSEIARIKKWICNSALDLNYEIEQALWDRRDKLLCRQGFIVGALVVGVISGIVLLNIVTQ